MNLKKLFICSILIIILLKQLLKRLNNIKYIIKEEKYRKQEELKQEKERKYIQLREEAQVQEEKSEDESTSFYNSYREGLDIDYIKKIRNINNSYREGLDIDYIKAQKKLEHKKAELHQVELNIEEKTMSYIDRLEDGYKFEEYIANLLKSLGYTNVEVTQGSGDYGADVLAEGNQFTYAIQCKWSSLGNNKVGNKAVQEIYSGKTLYNKDYGVVVTNSYFTQSAKESAKKLDIILWDRDKLKRLLEEARKKN